MARGVAIERVGFAYGATPVLDDVTLDVGKGEFFAFLGPSGSGKTTLLRLIAGFGTPDTGRILIGERDVTRLPPWSRNVGLVFQSYALWPHMSVAKNVAFGLERRKFRRAEIERKVAAALDLVGLGAFAERRPAQLSGGQQQRVALARTLVIEPDVLLLDEPLSNLDAKLRVEMRGELRALQRKLGITAIYVTHDQEEANAIADRIAVLDQGRIQQIGAPVELYDHPANRFVATFLGTANLIDGRLEAGGRFIAGGIAVDGINGPAGPACISVRPQDVTVTPAGQGIGAKISGREFLGGIIRYRMRIGAQETRRRRAASARRGSLRGGRPGRADRRSTAGFGAAPINSLGVMKDDAERMAMAGAQTAHAMPHVHPIDAPRALHRPMMDREDHAFALLERDHLGARLHARTLLGQHELAAGEVVAGAGEQERDLERKDMLAVKVLVQAIVVAGTVLQEQRRRLRLPRLVAAAKKRGVFGRIANRDSHRLIPAIGELGERRIEGLA